MNGIMTARKRGESNLLRCQGLPRDGDRSKPVESPTISVCVLSLAAPTCGCAGQFMFRRELCSQLHCMSQLVVVQFGGLQQATDLLPPFHICCFGVAVLLLLLHKEQLGVVARKLLQRDEEVSRVKAEPIVHGIQREQPLDEACYLRSVKMLACCR